MRNHLVLFLAVGAALLMQGCITKKAPVYTLGTPHFVPQSQPDSVVESGIGQDPGTGGIFLQWYTVTGAAGFRVYRTDSINASNLPVDFSVIGNIVSSSSLNDTSMVDVTSIKSGITYYYYLRAYAADGSLSNPSDTANYLLLDRPSLRYPINGGVVDSSSADFTWINLSGGLTVIRVQDNSVLPAVFIWVSRRFQIFDQYPRKPFDFDSVASQKLIPGHLYRWRVDRFDVDGKGRPFEGSRSSWSTFSAK